MKDQIDTPMSFIFALLTGTTAIGDDTETLVFWIKAGLSIGLACASIFFLVYDRVKAAKSKDSDGGEAVTIEESVEIARAAMEEAKEQMAEAEKQAADAMAKIQQAKADIEK